MVIITIKELTIYARCKRPIGPEVAKECKTVEDVHNALKDLFKRTIQEILEF